MGSKYSHNKDNEIIINDIISKLHELKTFISDISYLCEYLYTLGFIIDHFSLLKGYIY